MSEELPTIRSAILAHCNVAALCLECQHIQDLDLTALARRHASTLLIQLPLRCKRCGSRAFRIIVSGRTPGERRDSGGQT